MEVCKSNTCAVACERGRLVLKCGHGMQSSDFRECLMKALRYAREHAIKQWLFDVRQIGKLSEDEETWVQAQLFPQIMMYLGTDNYVAVVVDEQCYNDMVNDAGPLGLKSYNTFVIINTFCRVEEAQAWLDLKPSACT